MWPTLTGAPACISGRASAPLAGIELLSNGRPATAANGRTAGRREETTAARDVRGSGKRSGEQRAE